MSSQRDGNSKFWFGFFLGGLLGAITLYFIGTKEGRKRSKVLQDKSKDFVDELQDKLDDLTERGKELVDEGTKLKLKVVDTINENKDTMTGDVTQKLDNALAHIETIQERGRKTTVSIRKKIFKNLPKQSSS